MTRENNILYADLGKKLTNGIDFGETVYLSETDSVFNWYEITNQEYDKIIERIKNTP